LTSQRSLPKRRKNTFSSTTTTKRKPHKARSSSETGRTRKRAEGGSSEKKGRGYKVGPERREGNSSSRTRGGKKTPPANIEGERKGGCMERPFLEKDSNLQAGVPYSRGGEKKKTLRRVRQWKEKKEGDRG